MIELFQWPFFPVCRNSIAPTNVAPDARVPLPKSKDPVLVIRHQLSRAEVIQKTLGGIAFGSVGNSCSHYKRLLCLDPSNILILFPIDRSHSIHFVVVSTLIFQNFECFSFLNKVKTMALTTKH